MKKTIVCLLGMALLVACASDASAQSSFRQFKPKARKQWFAISAAWLNSMPLHLKEAPLGTSQRTSWEYESRGDGGITQVDVLEYRKRQRGLGVAVYPFGSSTGPSLMIKGSYETLPVFRATMFGPSNVSEYALTEGSAWDAGIGVIVADRAPGWGLGSHAYVVGGAGRLDTNLGGGSRIFGEGGGGLSIGPVGVELGVKFAYNKLSLPVEHGFYTVPVTLRATFGF
jgi:hypothetical protein